MTTTPRWVALSTAAAGVVALLVIEDLFGDALNEMLLHLPGVDKVLHFGQSMALFFVFHAVSSRLGSSPGTPIVTGVVGAFLAAVFDEFQQQWTAGRHVELADILAGMSGVAVAVAVVVARRGQRRAAGLALCGIAAGATLTYRSHLDTRDYNWGLLADRAGRRDEALRHYRAAAARGVSNPEAYNAAAWTIVDGELGDPREAVRFAERSLELRRDNPDALDTYGWALVNAGRPRDAVVPLERALADKPSLFCIHYHLAMAYLGVGRRDDGVRHLRRQVSEQPRTREAALAAKALAGLEPAATP